MLVPLTAIVTTSLPMAAAIALCAKDRKTVHGKNKSNKSARSSKSIRGKNSKSGKSSRSRRSKSQRSKRSSKSGKKGKSSKSGKGKNSGKSSKSKKSSKTASSSVSGISSASGPASEKSSKSRRSSRKGSKSSKSRKARRLDSDAQNKMEKSKKSTKTAKPVRIGLKCMFPIVICQQETTAGSQAAKTLVEEVNAIKHSTQLTVVPSKLQYQTLGGVNQIELKNTSGQRKAYKVKCSDNALYRVNPVYGFAEPHSSVKIDVLRLNGEQKTDKLVLVTANAKDASDPHEAFAKQAEQREMMVVPLVAA
uniref:Major sperm protein n=1 Tax=Caenorhabditis tropicalis TaxID=1561998 RepID=A0A1I7UYC5_9PELO